MRILLCCIAMSAFLPPAASQADPGETRRRASEVFLEAEEGFRQMYSQVVSMSARLESSQSASSRTVRQNGESPVDADGKFVLDTSTKWTSDILWDRASGNSVVETRRTSHSVNDVESVSSPASVLSYCTGGAELGYYPTIRSSSSQFDEVGTTRDEDLRVVTGFDSIPSIDGARVDSMLGKIREWYLVESQKGRNSVSVEETGEGIRITITWNDPDGAVRTLNRYVFAPMSFGIALTRAEQESARGRTRHEDVWEYGDPDPSDAKVMQLPLRRRSSIVSTEPDGSSHTSTEIVSLTRFSTTGAAYPEQWLRDEIAVRYGVLSGETMSPVLRAAPVHAEAQASE